MSSFNIKSPNSRFDLIANRIKYGTDGGINVDAGALYVNGINGRVGINTTSPQANFDISGTIRTNANITSSGMMDISGYYEVNGVPINNSFYPKLNSSVYGQKAVSAWDISTGLPNFVSANKIVWSPELGLFASVTGNLTANFAATSPDGINWTPRTTPTYGGNDIVWAPFVNARNSGLFLTVKEFGFVDSSNGITWNNSGFLNGKTYRGVTWAQDKQLFVAVADNANLTGSVAYSTDASNYSFATPPLACRSITYAPELGLFAAIGNNGVMTSTNGINWSITSTLPANNPRIIWSPQLGLFLGTNFIGGVSGNIFKISSDAVTWRDVSNNLTGVPVFAVTWSPELGIFYAISSSSVLSSYSSDGINWTTSSAIPQQATSVAWSPELGIFSAIRNVASPTANIYRSNLRGRPPTSFNVFDSSFNNINQLGLWNFQSFGRGVPVTKTANFTVQPGENWIVVNNAASTTVTLPAAVSWPGREITMKSLQNAVVSASSNVLPLGSDLSGTAILAPGGQKWATLVSDISNWVIMQSN